MASRQALARRIYIRSVRIQASRLSENASPYPTREDEGSFMNTTFADVCPRRFCPPEWPFGDGHAYLSVLRSKDYSMSSLPSLFVALAKSISLIDPCRRAVLSDNARLRQFMLFAMYNHSLMRQRTLVAVVIAAIAPQAGNAKRVEPKPRPSLRFSCFNKPFLSVSLHMQKRDRFPDVGLRLIDPLGRSGDGAGAKRIPNSQSGEVIQIPGHPTISKPSRWRCVTPYKVITPSLFQSTTTSNTSSW